MFQNSWIRAGVVAVAAFVVVYAAALALKSRKKETAVFPVRWGFFAAVVAGVIAYQAVGGTGNALPFSLWLRVREVGYKAVWIQFAATAAPFALIGFFLSWAIPWCNRLWKAAVCGLGTSALMAAVRLILPPFDGDIVVGAAIGIIVGFGIYAFVKLFFPKLRFFREPKLPRKTHLGSLLAVLGVYLACVGLIVIDSGSDFEQLNIFKPDTALPKQMTLTVELNGEENRVMTYRTRAANPPEDAVRIAQCFGISGTAKAVDKQADVSVRAMVEENGKSVVASLTGEWRYVDETFVSEANGVLLTAEKFEERAREIAANGNTAFTHYEVTDMVMGEKADAEGKSALINSVYLTAYTSDGWRIEGSCEMVVTLWYDGTLYSVDKYNADFEPFKEMKIISSEEAWKRVLEGSPAHTLWQKAESAQIDSVEIAYWLEEVKGVLQPIWLFEGVAQMADGGEKEFSIFVPALDY